MDSMKHAFNKDRNIEDKSIWKLGNKPSKLDSLENLSNRHSRRGQCVWAGGQGGGTGTIQQGQR